MACVAPCLTPMKGDAPQGEHELREVFNGLRWIVRTGSLWRCMPNDLPAMLRCGYPMAVANAVEQVRSAAAYVTTAPGGHAAAREAIEHVLLAQGLWDQVVERYGM
jgi:hypothetical protein